MTDHTPSDARADSNAAADRSGSSADQSGSPTDRSGSPTDRSATADREPIAVLHVEPDAHSAELLEAFSRRLTDRIRVRSADRFADALNAVETGVEIDGERVAVDCVVTEQRLLDGSGSRLTERLREADPGLPVVFYTTCPSEDGEAAAFGAGADAYFEKGSERGRYDAILDRIRALVDERRGREADGGPGVASTPRAPGAPGATLRSEE